MVLPLVVCVAAFVLRAAVGDAAAVLSAASVGAHVGVGAAVGVPVAVVAVAVEVAAAVARSAVGVAVLSVVVGDADRLQLVHAGLGQKDVVVVGVDLPDMACPRQWLN